MCFSKETSEFVVVKALIKHKQLSLNVTIIINAISNNDMEHFPTEAKAGYEEEFNP